jgi:hypothetical protein
LRRWLPACRRALSYPRLHCQQPFETEFNMGKYFLAWLLGVPGVVLVLIYLFFH